MQAITVKYYPPTNRRGSRYKASCPAGSIWVAYPYGIGHNDEALYAAAKLQAKLGWNYDLAEGNAVDGSTVFVCIPPNRYNVVNITHQKEIMTKEDNS